jgi:ribosomal protein S25
MSSGNNPKTLRELQVFKVLTFELMNKKLKIRFSMEATYLKKLTECTLIKAYCIG